MKKFDPTPRTKEIILHAFYENILYDNYGKEICRSSASFDDLYKKYGPLYDNDIDHDIKGYYDIEDIPLNVIVDAYNQIPFKDLYKNIKLTQTYDRDGYKSEPCIVGDRTERPDEIELRRKEYEDVILAQKNTKLAKKQRALENKKKQLEKLQGELKYLETDTN